MLEIAENVVLVLAKIQRFLGGNGHALNSLERSRYIFLLHFLLERSPSRYGLIILAIM